MSRDIPSNLVSKLRAEVVVPYKDGYEPLRAPPSKLMTDAADEIERLTADFQQVHHNCIHARQVADKALELLGAVPRDLMPMSWCRLVDEAKELARSVPPIPVPETSAAHIGNEDGWIPVERSQPRTGVKVLGYWKNELGKDRRTCVEYIAPRSIDAESICWDNTPDDWFDYDESGTSWVPSGWYERVEGSDEYPYTEIPVTHWRPLPAVPALKAAAHPCLAMTDEYGTQTCTLTDGHAGPHVWSGIPAPKTACSTPSISKVPT